MRRADWEILHGDSREALKFLPDACIDSVVTDPPYELGFMGKKWDASGIAYDLSLWREVLRVLKPGGHLLVFGGTRTYHRMACAIEDAGFEIRDSIHWIYATGFPKSFDVSKALDKEETAAAWEGWGTALKPAHEPIVVARKPLDGTVAANVLAHGTGGMNIDACRVGSESRTNPPCRTLDGTPSLGGGWNPNAEPTTTGRWPPNIVLGHADGCEPVGTRTDSLPKTVGKSGKFYDQSEKVLGGGWSDRMVTTTTTTKWRCVEGCPVLALDQQTGESAAGSRFFPSFYCAKPSRKERDAGCEALPERTAGEMTDRVEGSAGLSSPRAGAGRTSGGRNDHATVKPVALMRWLCRLVTPKNGVVLDPFAGSGTTGMAALAEGFSFLGVELLDEHAVIAEARITHAAEENRCGTISNLF